MIQHDTSIKRRKPLDRYALGLRTSCAPSVTTEGPKRPMQVGSMGRESSRSDSLKLGLDWFDIYA